MASVPESKARNGGAPKRAPYLFRGESQRRALDYLRYALEKGRGVFALVGPAGVGKTTVARQVIREWKADADAVVLLSGERVGGNGIHRQLASGLGLAHYSLPRPRLMAALERNFAARLSKGGRTLLIIDDADHLQRAELEELSTLCALQRAGHALLQVFLIGRHLRFAEPAQRGKADGMDQLIGSYRLAPLAESDVAQFVAGWGEYEGYKDLPRLPAALCERIAQWSECRPRKLKRFCEQLRGVVVKGRGLAWDSALVERLIDGASSAFHAVKPPLPPVDFTVGGEVQSAQSETLQSGPESSAARHPVDADSTADASPPTPTAVLDMPSVPAVQETDQGAIDTPLLAICASVEEAYVLAPLIKALGRQAGRCTVLVDEGELNAARPPWNSRSQRVVWRPAGVKERESRNPGERLAVAVRNGAALLADGRARLLLSLGSGDTVLGLGLAAHKLGVTQVRVEAGRRSAGAAGSPDTNQALLERLADCLLVGDSLSQVNLLMEGIPRQRIREVGSLRVDALASLLARAGVDFAQASDPQQHGAGGARSGCALVVLRDERTCGPGQIELLLRVLRDIGEMLPIRLLVSQPLMEALHPSGPVRQWRKWNIDMLALIDPVRSLELLVDARIVITDSDLMQVESTALRVPCITLSEETSWPITVECGGNRLCRLNPVEIIDAVSAALTEPLARDTVPPLWDGRAAARAAQMLAPYLA